MARPNMARLDFLNQSLERFVFAQANVYEQVLRELRAGEKQSHWMWFIFPQIQGLGFSSMAQRYALASCDEARAYLAHPVLGARLRHCTALVNAAIPSSANEIFGSPDDLKFHSCLTLFAHASSPATDSAFHTALQSFFQGVEDQATLDRL